MDSLEYWQGVTDGRLAAIEENVKEIKESVKSIDSKILTYRFRKTKAAGIASAVAGGVMAAAEVVRALVK